MNKFIAEWKKRFPHEDLPANLIDYLESGDSTEYKRKFKDVYPDKVEFVEWYEKNKGLSEIEIIEKHIDDYIKIRKEKQFNIINGREATLIIIALDVILKEIKEQENEH